MGEKMKILEELIIQNGKVIDNSILKVDSFLNHQIDANLMFEIGKEFKERFKDKKIDKILTIEASGIAMGVTVAYFFGVPLVFAKKKKPVTANSVYTSKVFSFTKKKEYDIIVSKDFIKAGEKVLIVDDFLAMGGAVIGLESIVKQAGAEIVGVGIVIEKGFQEGAKLLREKGLHVESLAIIKGFENGKVIL
jgi:xanthine phosphoribosyltransferase